MLLKISQKMSCKQHLENINFLRELKPDQVVTRAEFEVSEVENLSVNFVESARSLHFN